MNMVVQISLPDPAFNSFGCTPRSGIAGSYGSSIFNFSKDLHSIFRSDCNLSTNSAQWFQFLHILANMLFSVLLIVAILTGVRQ